MKLRTSIFAVAAALFAACGTPSGELSTGIIPAPDSVAWGEGAFRMPETLAWTTDLDRKSVV